jgi:hypothetical protein
LKLGTCALVMAGFGHSSVGHSVGEPTFYVGMLSM